MQIESAHSPRWSNPEHSRIDLIVKFAEVPDEHPFTACPYDVMEYGAVLYAKAQAGEFGEVAEYIAPPSPPAPPVVDPVDKLKAFLSANPDVVSLLK